MRENTKNPLNSLQSEGGERLNANSIYNKNSDLIGLPYGFKAGLDEYNKPYSGWEDRAEHGPMHACRQLVNSSLIIYILQEKNPEFFEYFKPELIEMACFMCSIGRENEDDFDLDTNDPRTLRLEVFKKLFPGNDPLSPLSGSPEENETRLNKYLVALYHLCNPESHTQIKDNETKKLAFIIELSHRIDHVRIPEIKETVSESIETLLSNEKGMLELFLPTNSEELLELRSKLYDLAHNRMGKLDSDQVKKKPTMTSDEAIKFVQDEIQNGLQFYVQGPVNKTEHDDSLVDSIRELFSYIGQEKKDGLIRSLGEGNISIAATLIRDNHPDIYEQIKTVIQGIPRDDGFDVNGFISKINERINQSRSVALSDINRHIELKQLNVESEDELKRKILEEVTKTYPDLIYSKQLVTVDEWVQVSKKLKFNDGEILRSILKDILNVKNIEPESIVSNEHGNTLTFENMLAILHYTDSDYEAGADILSSDYKHNEKISMFNLMNDLLRDPQIMLNWDQQTIKQFICLNICTALGIQELRILSKPSNRTTWRKEKSLLNRATLWESSSCLSTTAETINSSITGKFREVNLPYCNGGHGALPQGDESVVYEFSGNPVDISWVTEKYEDEAEYIFPPGTQYISKRSFRNSIEDLAMMGVGAINTKGTNGKTPLYSRCAVGNIKDVELLLLNGADITLQEDLHSNTPLHIASQNGHLNIVLVLLLNKADINATNRFKKTPLHLACNKGNLELVQALIDEGADINAKARNGVTPLDIAFDYGHLDVYKVLSDANESLQKEKLDPQEASVKKAFEILLKAMGASEGQPGNEDDIGHPELQKICNDPYRIVECMNWDDAKAIAPDVANAIIETILQSPKMLKKVVFNTYTFIHFAEKFIEHKKILFESIGIINDPDAFNEFIKNDSDLQQLATVFPDQPVFRKNTVEEARKECGFDEYKQETVLGFFSTKMTEADTKDGVAVANSTKT